MKYLPFGSIKCVHCGSDECQAVCKYTGKDRYGATPQRRRTDFLGVIRTPVKVAA